MIRVVLVDDHAMMRDGYTAMLAVQGDIEVVGAADCGEAALGLARSLKPDVLVCDYHMPGMTGLEVAERLLRSQSRTRVVMASVLGDGPIPRRALAAGVLGYVSKCCGGVELARAIREAAAGRRYLGADIARVLAMEGLSGTASAVDALTPRELEVSLLLVQGLKMTEVGERLKLSAKTVATHKYRSYDKLGVRDVVNLARVLRQQGVFDPVCA